LGVLTARSLITAAHGTSPAGRSSNVASALHNFASTITSEPSMFDTIPLVSLTSVVGGQCVCGGQGQPQDPNAGGDPRLAMRQPGGEGDPSGGDPSAGGDPSGAGQPQGGMDWRQILGWIGGMLQQFAQAPRAS
jgi:hypothetical protein